MKATFSLEQLLENLEMFWKEIPERLGEIRQMDTIDITVFDGDYTIKEMEFRDVIEAFSANQLTEDQAKRLDKIKKIRDLVYDELKDARK